MGLVVIVGVVLIDWKIYKIMRAQEDHNRKVEAILTEILDKTFSK